MDGAWCPLPVDIGEIGMQVLCWVLGLRTLPISTKMDAHTAPFPADFPKMCSWQDSARLLKGWLRELTRWNGWPWISAPREERRKSLRLDGEVELLDHSI